MEAELKDKFCVGLLSLNSVLVPFRIISNAICSGRAQILNFLDVLEEVKSNSPPGLRIWCVDRACNFAICQARRGFNITFRAVVKLSKNVQ